MQYANEGIVLAQPIAGKYGISESGENKLTTFAADFLVTHYKAEGGEWVDAGPDQTITGYFFLEKRDGSLNANTIDKLKSVFGWNGADPFWLQDTDLSGAQVQLTLENETYNGRVRLKVKWIDVPGAEGAGVKRTEGDARRALADRVGAKFRANAGGTVAAPPKPAGRPAPVSPPQGPPQAPPAMTLQYVWDRWVLACKSKESAGELWKSIVLPMFPGVVNLTDEHAQRIWDEGFPKLKEVPF